jgi:hypothetical protein
MLVFKQLFTFFKACCSIVIILIIIMLNVFFGYAGSGSGLWSGQSGSGQIQSIENLKRLYYIRWGGNKWPRRPHWVGTIVQRLVATVWRFAWWFFCWRGSWTACPSAVGGDGGDGHHYWWWCGLSQRIWVIFLQGEKFIGEWKFARLLALNFHSRMNAECCGDKLRVSRDRSTILHYSAIEIHGTEE